jgi:hypothetical protein
MGIKKRFFIAFCLAIILIGGGLALLSGARQNAPTYAARNLPDSDLSVVGPPTLPASTVDSIFARLGSPMVGAGALVELTSRQTNIDDAFALAVWWTETNDGAAGVGLADRNPGSVRGSIGYPSAYDGYTIYPSYAAAVVYWYHMLKNIYTGRGLSTVYAISHPYVGTSTSYLWAGKVVALMLRYRGEAPPPTPSPTVDPNVLARDRRNIGPVNTGTTGTTSTQPPASGLKAAQHAALPFQQQTQKQSSVLSATATWLIAIFALLLALAIALCVQLLSSGLRIGTRSKMFDNVPAEKPFTTLASYGAYHPPTFQAPVYRLPSHSLNEPQTDALVGARFIAPAPTTGVLRRTRLMPEQLTSDLPEEVTVPTGARPTGLLARYGNTRNV